MHRSSYRAVSTWTWGFAILAACAEATPPSPGVDETEQQSDTSIETVPAIPDEVADQLFTLDMVHMIDLSLADEAIAALAEQPRDYVSGGVTIDGELFQNVGIRLKGEGTFRDLTGKAAFKIDFNAFDDTQSFHGKSKLTLNNMNSDHTQLHEAIAFEVFRAAGLAASRVGYAWVSVNEEVYGLYANVETPDGDFLERSYGNRDGNLYEGGFTASDQGTLIADFTPSQTSYFELESGTDLDNADLQAVTDVLAAPASPEFEADLAALLDIDDYARFQLAEAWAGHRDGYAFNSHNFRVYVDHGGDESVHLLVSGVDNCFTDPEEPLAEASAALGLVCQQNEACNAHFGAVLVETLGRVDAADLTTRLDEAYTLVRPYIDADPRNSIIEGASLDARVDQMRDWIQTRSAVVDEWYGP